MPKLARLGAALAASSLCLLALPGCASRPEPPAPAAPAARIEAGTPRLLDQRSLLVPLVLVVSNPGDRELKLESAELRLEVEGEKEPLGLSLGPAALAAPVPARGEARLPAEFALDLRGFDEAVVGPGGPARAGWELRARIGARREGLPAELEAEAEGSFPLVREPRLRISSVGIGRDILVVTDLEIALEIENPNDFPLAFSALDYEFQGEGRYWAEGSRAEELLIPARASRSVVLEGSMNFANMDRRLFDLVATLKVVRYRLKGGARIATGLEALPAFELAFDQSGSCEVKR
ncbi:MAG TPA: LEA type 2 family protein [Spirochaetales bacterium]|nr:LEA type 2 family protein [Spirochaetales bacterium]HRY56484.1 LEA type 2 family protein [Spirochaetia bacterium]HRZ63991.1 LEA type 2 family protein [Spirochaetia bacterium]